MVHDPLVRGVIYIHSYAHHAHAKYNPRGDPAAMLLLPVGLLAYRTAATGYQVEFGQPELVGSSNFTHFCESGSLYICWHLRSCALM